MFAKSTSGNNRSFGKGDNMAGKFRTFYASYEEWVKHKQHRIASSGEFLAKQLSENPAVAKEWDAKKWSNLVAARPEFADQCPWKSFDGGNWSLILRFQPQFADKCPWRKLGGGDWADLLIMQPQFADKCAWSKLTTDNWDSLLEAQPQFAGRKPKKPKVSGKKREPRPAPCSYVSREVKVSLKNGKVVAIRHIEDGKVVASHYFENGKDVSSRHRGSLRGK